MFQQNYHILSINRISPHYQVFLRCLNVILRYIKYLVFYNFNHYAYRKRLCWIHASCLWFRNHDIWGFYRIYFWYYLFQISVLPQCKSTLMQLKPKHQIQFVSHFSVFIISELTFLSCKILASPNPLLFFYFF